MHERVLQIAFVVILFADTANFNSLLPGNTTHHQGETETCDPAIVMSLQGCFQSQIVHGAPAAGQHYLFQHFKPIILNQDSPCCSVGDACLVIVPLEIVSHSISVRRSLLKFSSLYLWNHTLLI
jgi:hypothetical protein